MYAGDGDDERDDSNDTRNRQSDKTTVTVTRS